MQFVRSYRRPSDGVRVRGHLRKSPPASTGLGIAGVLGVLAALAVFAPGSHSSGVSGSAPAARDTATVVYVGPYPSTAAGGADADRVASTLPGSVVREVHAR